MRMNVKEKAIGSAVWLALLLVAVAACAMLSTGCWSNADTVANLDKVDLDNLVGCSSSYDPSQDCPIDPENPFETPPMLPDPDPDEPDVEPENPIRPVDGQTCCFTFDFSGAPLYMIFEGVCPPTFIPAPTGSCTSGPQEKSAVGWSKTGCNQEEDPGCAPELPDNDDGEWHPPLLPPAEPEEDYLHACADRVIPDECNYYWGGCPVHTVEVLGCGVEGPIE